MARAAQPVEPARRERAVVVADLVEDLRRLAQQARVLVLVEPRLGEHVGGEIDHRVEVARQREARERDRSRGDTPTSSAAPSESSVSSSAARSRAGAAAREQGGVAVQALDAERIGGRAAADRDVEPDERRVGRRLDDDGRAGSCARLRRRRFVVVLGVFGLGDHDRAARRHAGTSRTTRATSSAVTCGEPLGERR